jgi:hypothetical protein
MRNCFRRLLAITAGSFPLLLVAAPLLAQATAPGPTSYRKLAPGVEQVIEPDDIPNFEPTSRHDLPEILAVDPKFGEREGGAGRALAKDVRVKHQFAGLRFTFKPVRYIRSEVPDAQGRLEPKLVWYMVYHVTNPNQTPFRFFPEFTLESKETHHAYADKLLALAVPLIQRREDPNRRLLNTVEIAGELAAGATAWGVVTWDSIDPGTDRFTISIEGLSSAYQWEEAAEGQPRKILQKTLQLNFWRPGDAFYEHEAEVRYGAPGDVDYRWVFR